MFNRRIEIRTARVAGLSLILLAAVSLSACDTANRILGTGKRAPDEFVVYSQPPLSLPPDYGLRPPEPGREREQRVNASARAQAALTGPRRQVQQEQLGQATPGVLALLEQTGANKAEPGIRRLVDKETSALSDEDRRLIDRLIFWVDDEGYQGTVVDASKEQRRILEKQALGRPVNEGDVPEITRERQRKSVLGF